MKLPHAATTESVAIRVCAFHGHKIFHVDRSDLNVDRSYSQFMCEKCGASIEEIRETKEKKGHGQSKTNSEQVKKDQ